MKLETKTGFVGTSSDFEKKAFNIEASAQAFAVLSSQLYTNKIRAIIRELSCNAVDAMRMAGTLDKKKFLVKMPNNMDPKFSIRDYGTGISPEDIENVYTTYFQSTKRDSNDQIGCLGLGSKTPFCYTDNFQVNSYYNGVKHTYNAIIDEHQMPQVLKIEQTATTEENGLEVTFSVKPSDFQSFYREAENTYVWFNHHPTIVGAQISIPDSTWKNSTITKAKGKSGDWSWRIVSIDTYGPLRGIIGPQVIMGGVAYQLNSSSFENIGNDVASILRMNVHIEVPIGEVKPAANRESLHLDNKSKISIKNKLVEICQSIVENIDKTVAGCSNKWDALSTWNSSKSRFDGYMNEFIRQSGYVAKFKGEILVDSHVYPWGASPEFTVPHSTLHKPIKPGSTGPREAEEFQPTDRRLITGFSISTNPRFVWMAKDSVRSEQNIELHLGRDRKKYLSQQSGYSHPYEKSQWRGIVLLNENHLLKEDGTTYTRDEVLAWIDCPKSNFVDIEDLENAEEDSKFLALVEEEEAIAKEKRIKKKDEAYEVKDTDVYRDEDKACVGSLQVVDLDEGSGYYFKCHFRKPMSGTEEFSPRYVVKMLKNLNAFNSTQKKAYGLTEKQIAKFGKDSEWKDIFEEHKKLIEKLLVDKNVESTIRYENVTSYYNQKYNVSWFEEEGWKLSVLKEVMKNIDKNHELKKVEDSVKEYNNKSNVEKSFNVDAFQTILRSVWGKEFTDLKVKVSEDQIKEVEELNKLIAETWEKNPILEIVFPRGISMNVSVNKVSDLIVSLL